MANITAVKGSDIPLTITMSDTIINDLDNVIVYFYHKMTRVVVTKFSIVVIAGYKTITVTDSGNGVIDIIVPNADTVNAKIGLYQCSYKTIDTDAGYPDGYDDDMVVVDGIVNLLDNPISTEEWQS